MSDREPPLEGSDQGYYGLKEEAEQITEESREQSEPDSGETESAQESASNEAPGGQR